MIKSASVIENARVRLGSLNSQQGGWLDRAALMIFETDREGKCSSTVILSNFRNSFPYP